jgi:hypothetical protein
MNTTSTISSSTLDATARERSTRRVATIGALAATVANVALWLGGRAADVDFRVSPLLGPPIMQVGVVSVVLTTLLAFAAGWTVLTLAARRSRQLVRVVMAAAAVVAVVSTAGPLSTALNTATGVLLAAMHLITGAAFLAAAATVRAR